MENNKMEALFLPQDALIHSMKNWSKNQNRWQQAAAKVKSLAEALLPIGVLKNTERLPDEEPSDRPEVPVPIFAVNPAGSGKMRDFPLFQASTAQISAPCDEIKTFVGLVPAQDFTAGIAGPLRMPKKDPGTSSGAFSERNPKRTGILAEKPESMLPLSLKAVGRMPAGIQACRTGAGQWRGDAIAGRSSIKTESTSLPQHTATLLEEWVRQYCTPDLELLSGKFAGGRYLSEKRKEEPVVFKPLADIGLPAQGQKPAGVCKNEMRQVLCTQKDFYRATNQRPEDIYRKAAVRGEGGVAGETREINRRLGEEGTRGYGNTEPGRPVRENARYLGKNLEIYGSYRPISLRDMEPVDRREALDRSSTIESRTSSYMEPLRPADRAAAFSAGTEKDTVAGAVHVAVTMNGTTIREEADIDKLANRLAERLQAAGLNYGGVY